MSCSNSEEKNLEDTKAQDRDRCHRDDHRSRKDLQWQQTGAKREKRIESKYYRSNRKHNSKQTSVATQSERRKSGTPNCIIMVKELPYNVKVDDIRKEIDICGLLVKDIRLVQTKKKLRGFAFVEFQNVDDASKWMNMKQGVLVLQNRYRAVMQFNIPQLYDPNFEKVETNISCSDWFCIKCGTLNFKRRTCCFKCRSSRAESEIGGSGISEVCNYITKTIMLRNLDALTTEETVIHELNNLVPDAAKKIFGVSIGRDTLTSLSRGICYLKTDSITDARVIYEALKSITPRLNIDGKTVTISYCKNNLENTQYSYNQALQGLDTDADTKNADASQSVVQKICAVNNFTSVQQVIPNGIDQKLYPFPDINTYAFDSDSGYYYDFSTGLYYHLNSNCYWNSEIQKYLYYDEEKLTYLLVPPSRFEQTSTTSKTIEITTVNSEFKKSEVEEQLHELKEEEKLPKDMYL